ncbi:MAG TPA: polyprenol monophosphomannose synthase [Candidatus Eisenbacteria bacterium]|nr:polyprenol monophosphomannose synthase [Candidatus Eisenbacteria bacterium]
MSGRDLLVVVPTYNERDNLPELVDGIRANLPGAHVLVVDDGSPDGTAAVARELGAATGDVAVLERDRPRGIGSAYRHGFRAGLERGYRRFVSMDADLSHDPKHLPALVAASETADFAIGSRYLHGVSVVNWSLGRLAASVGANAYARTVTGLPVRDCTSGFQCVRREVLEAIGIDGLRRDGYAFLIEFKYRAFRRGFRFQEVPIVFVERRSGISKNGIPSGVKTMWAVWALRFGAD